MKHRLLNWQAVLHEAPITEMKCEKPLTLAVARTFLL